MGPLFTNNSNNDASIWKDCLTRNRNGMLAWLEENDLIIVDRGFQDSIGTINALGPSSDTSVPQWTKNCNSNLSVFLQEDHF